MSTTTTNTTTPGQLMVQERVRAVIEDVLARYGGNPSGRAYVVAEHLAAAGLLREERRLMRGNTAIGALSDRNGHGEPHTESDYCAKPPACVPMDMARPADLPGDLRARVVAALEKARRDADALDFDTTVYDALLRDLAGAGEPAPTPVVAKPRRMQGIPAADPGSPHTYEHDEITSCAWATPCQPVAAVGEPDMRHKLTEEQIAQRLAVDNLLHPYGRCTCAGEGRCAWCQQYEDTRLDEPAHEHRWAAVAGDAWTGNERGCFGWRVTREHCVVGDCPATREVGHDA